MRQNVKIGTAKCTMKIESIVISKNLPPGVYLNSDVFIFLSSCTHVNNVS